MPELQPSDIRAINEYDEIILGIRIIAQYSGDDDGYYIAALTPDREIAYVGPYTEMGAGLKKIGQEIRRLGYWEE